MSESGSNDALSAYLQQAAADLARSNNALGDDADGLLFLGAWHQSYPAILVRDPFLSDSAKLQFLFLMQESSQSPYDPIAMPSLLETGQVLGHAKKTVHRDRTLLRVCRWISQHKCVRDSRGRYCGSINAIHSEPCSLSEAHRLDATYLQLLNESQSHPDRFVQQAAQAALASIDQTLQEGGDPMEAPDPMNRRLDAARAVQNGGGSFFDLLMPAGANRTPTDTPDEAGHTVASTESEAEFTLGERDETQPSVNFDHRTAGHSVASPGNEEKFTLGERGDSRPSVNFAGETAGHTVASPQGGVNFTPGDPSAKFTPGQSDPSVNFTPGLQTADNKEKNENSPQNAKFTLGPTCSSSNTTTTNNKTDNDSDSSQSNQATESDSASELRWPDKLSANHRALIERGPDFQALDATQRQDVLDALAHKLGDADKPVRSPIGYVVTLCKRVQAGTFQPVGAPAAKAGPDGTNDAAGQAQREVGKLRQQLRELHSEIDGMESTLIPGAPPENRPTLEAQRDRLVSQSKQLKERLRSLRGESGSQRASRA